ncbi:MAG: ABC transporter ATP-binding protein [Dehalobacterium sp.]
MNKQDVLLLKNMYKTYPGPSGQEKLHVLEDISLQIGQGEIIALLGPSGCGKSTVLNISAGFESPDAGEVLFFNQPVTAPSPQRSVVFQSAVLFPWLTVRQNIAYGLKRKKMSRSRIEEESKKFINLVGLEGFDNYYPHQLSGGMQQRVALARVLILEPQMLLMDEPFAALDYQTRISMQQLLLSISMQLNPSILFVTHDVDEALILADRIYIMSRLPGRIIREIIVPFQKPRSISTLTQQKFMDIKQEIFQLLLEGSL